MDIALGDGKETLGVVEEILNLLVAQIIHRDEVAHRFSSAKPGACRLCVLL